MTSQITWLVWAVRTELREPKLISRFLSKQKITRPLLAFLCMKFFRFLEILALNVSVMNFSFMAYIVAKLKLARFLHTSSDYVYVFPAIIVSKTLEEKKCVCFEILLIWCFL